MVAPRRLMRRPAAALAACVAAIGLWQLGTGIYIPAKALVDGYRGMLSHQNANVMVDEPFDFQARLIPILSAAEETVLPQGEGRNLEQGWSTLIDEARAEFPVRFFLYGGELSWQAR